MNTAKKTIGIVCFICVLIILAVSCSPADDAGNPAQAGPYFSLEDFFSTEISRLQQRLPEIAKTVTKNGETETHDLQIKNWRNELALFIDSDINKSAWQHSYQIDSTANIVRYSSLDPALRTQQIVIEKDSTGAVTHVTIRNEVNNTLYQSNEQLDYYPDSLYRINKKQHIVVIGENTYTITGVLL